MARCFFVFFVPRFCKHRWASSADHHDVQSHGREAKVANERSLREDYGFLSYVARSGSSATGDLRWLSQAPLRRWNTCWHHVHCARRGRDDFAQLVVREIREASSSQQRTLRLKACGARNHRRGDYQTRSRLDPQPLSGAAADRLVCWNAFRGNQLPFHSHYGGSSESTIQRRTPTFEKYRAFVEGYDRGRRITAS